MGTSTESDFEFTYDKYRDVITTATERFRSVNFGEWEEVTTDEPLLLLRHDVDLSLTRADKMARVEHDLGISSTYMIMGDSLLYSLEDDHSRERCRQLVELGHEVGLHYNRSKWDETASEDAIAKDVEQQADMLAAATGEPVQSISYHSPEKHLLYGPSHLYGYVNAYSESLMDEYISDSGGSWYEGDPRPVIRSHEGDLLQILVHPVWWGETDASSIDRLNQLFRELTAGKPPEERRQIGLAFEETLPGLELESDEAGIRN